MDAKRSCKTCPAWKKGLFSELSDEQLDVLAEQKQPLIQKKGGVLFRQGEAVEGLFCIGSGTLKLVYQDPHGREKIVRLEGAGGSVGHRSLFTSNTYRASCVAKADVAACHVPRATVLECLNTNTHFSHKFISRIAQDLMRAENERLSEASVPERLASLLSRLKNDFGGSAVGNEFALAVDLTKVEIASMLAVAEETVVRAFAQFKRDGWVRFEGKRIVLLNECALNNLGLHATRHA